MCTSGSKGMCEEFLEAASLEERDSLKERGSIRQCVSQSDTKGEIKQKQSNKHVKLLALLTLCSVCSPSSVQLSSSDHMHQLSFLCM